MIAAAPNMRPTTELRLTTRLIHYWQDLRGIRGMPEENDIDPDALGADWGNCFLLQTRDVKNIVDYNFTYLGANIMRAYSDAALDAFNHALVGPNAHCLSKIFEQVISTGAPILDEGEFATQQGRRVLYRQCALPLGNEDKGVEAVFGGMSYKVVD